MTKYEKAQILGARATQLSEGATPFVNTVGMDDVLKIAEKELKYNKIPIIIRRTMPDGSTTDHKTCELLHI